MKQMAKLAAVFMLSLLVCAPAKAQLGFKPFKEWGVGVEIGTTGVGFEVATSIHSMLNVRGGFSFLPISYSTDFDIDYDRNAISDLRQYQTQFPQYFTEFGVDLDQIDGNVELDAKSGIYNGKILVDFHPIPSAGFHITAGLYFGRERIISVEGGSQSLRTLYNANELIGKYGYQWGIQPFDAGVVIGDNTIEPDKNGYIDAGIKIQKVKPYLGIGFGRAIPKKRVGVQFDMGCMFHGKPTIISKNAGVADLLNDELDSSGFVDVMNKITVYPVISLKLTGRIL